jgi:hypothetical protein
MERKLVTCPETAHLEEIEYESTPCGMLIASCSRFQPRRDVECARECAARLDRRSCDSDRGCERDQGEDETDALLENPSTADDT